MKKILALIGRIIFLVLAIIVFLFSIGTVFTAIPFFGSIANIITVGWLHLWLPLCIVLCLIGLGLCLVNRKNRLNGKNRLTGSPFRCPSFHWPLRSSSSVQTPPH